MSVQTMCNTKTWDVESTVAQIRAMEAAGAEIVHLKETHNKKITKESHHFIFIQKSAVRKAGSIPENSEGMIIGGAGVPSQIKAITNDLNNISYP